MNTAGRSAPSLIISSFFVALLLSIMPYPDWASSIRPQWLTLLIIFWCLHAPLQVGITAGWVSGLLLDVLTGNLLGAQALGMALIAFITLTTYQRLRIFPLWQQSLVVFALLLLERLLLYWVISISKGVSPGIEFWFAPVAGLLIWPWLSILLTELQLRTSRSL